MNNFPGISSEEKLNSALQEVQQAAMQIKQEYLAEISMLHRTLQALENENKDLRIQLQKSAELQTQMSNNLTESKIEIDKLKSVNNTLSKALQEKDAELSKFLSLNQSLKNLLDQTGDQTSLNLSSHIPQSNTNASQNQYMNSFSPNQISSNDTTQFVTTQNTLNSKVHNFSSINSGPTSHSSFEARTPVIPSQYVISNTYQSPYFKSSTTPTIGERTKSKTQLFIQNARKELTATEFNEMISLINMYNKHQQTKDETLSNIQRILLPSHHNLYDQFVPMLTGI